jgi:hypothetical protein
MIEKKHERSGNSMPITRRQFLKICDRTGAAISVLNPKEVNYERRGKIN